MSAILPGFRPLSSAGVMFFLFQVFSDALSFFCFYCVLFRKLLPFHHTLLVQQASLSSVKKKLNSDRIWHGSLVHVVFSTTEIVEVGIGIFPHFSSSKSSSPYYIRHVSFKQYMLLIIYVLFFSIEIVHAGLPTNQVFF